MLRKIIASLLLASATLAAASAQSPDGIYLGRVELTKDVERRSGAARCTATGTPTEFRVTAPAVSIVHTRSGKTFSGSLAGDGAFRILGHWPEGGPGTWIATEWKGTLKGSRIDGNSVSIGSGRSCYHSFTARKNVGR